MDPNAHNGMNNLHGGDDMNQNNYASLYGAGDASQQHYGVYGQELGYGQMVNPTMPPRALFPCGFPTILPRVNHAATFRVHIQRCASTLWGL
jgi:hypothetical protein